MREQISAGAIIAALDQTNGACYIGSSGASSRACDTCVTINRRISPRRNVFHADSLLLWPVNGCSRVDELDFRLVGQR